MKFINFGPVVNPDGTPTQATLEIMGVKELAPCPACGYVLHDIPTAGDSAHADLCCGMPDGNCAWYRSADLCVTHDSVALSIAKSIRKGM
jgi:hypothetical protein